ncbi:MAG: DinB family protein, partial [Ignavibacteriaceae bacterium]|nr:DinB family protein [Ignavibacteriaceae bacterium]
YNPYIESVGDENPLKVMVEQAREYAALFDYLSEETAEKSYAEGKWSVKELLGHIVDTERIMSYRALSIARGETQSLPGYDHDDYVLNGKFNNRSIKSLVEEFIKLREANIILFDSFDTETLQKTGTASNNKVSVRALIYIIAGHAAHHINVFKQKYQPVI